MICGIDPGKTGGVAFIEISTGLIVDVFPMPDFRELPEIFKKYSHAKEVCIEEAFIIPGQGNKSNFTIGKNYGIILGCLYSVGFKVAAVHPATWKSDFGLQKKGKAGSIAMCEQVFPGVRDRIIGPKGGVKDGMAEALLIAEWGRLQYKKKLLADVVLSEKKKLNERIKQYELFSD